jgi:protein FAM50
MFANGYVGTSEDAQRLRKLDKQREEQRKKFEELQEKKKREAAGLRQFGASKAEAYEAAFKSETVGLVTRKEFLEKRATIQERLEEDEARERAAADAAAAADKARRKKEKEAKRAKAKLSFAADVSVGAGGDVVAAARRASAARSTDGCVHPTRRSSRARCASMHPSPVPHHTPQEDDEDEGGDGEPAASPSTAAAAADGGGGGSSGDGPSTSGAGAPEAPPAAKRPKFSRLGKDPGVATNFLPDRDREMQEEELRQQLKRVRQRQGGCAGVMRCQPCS